MALDPSAEYPGQVATGDAGYPYGKAQNVTVEGDGTGTPLEKALVNDLFGFQQALLDAADIAPSGVPDQVGASQYLQAFYQLLGRADGWGALGDDATDDTAALQAGLAAVAARSSGRQEFHFVPGKTYRTTGLAVPVNVDLHFHGATIKNTHATNHLLTYSNAGGRHKQKLTNAIFGSTVSAAGSVVRLQSFAVHLQIENCNFTGTATGKCIDVQSSAIVARLHCVECVFEGTTANYHVDFAAVGGGLSLERCRSISVATRTASCVRIAASAKAWVTKHAFDLTAHSSGALACIEVGAGAVVNITDNEYIQDTDPALTYAVQWTAAATIIERGSSYSGNITPYLGSVVLTEGSHLELLPHGKDDSTDESYTLPDDYQSFSLQAGFATFPIALTMPTIRFIGQEYDLQLYNKNVTDWATTVDIDAMGPPVATVGDPLEGAHIRTGRFRVMWNDFGSDYRWTLVGGWSEQYVRGTPIGS